MTPFLVYVGVLASSAQDTPTEGEPYNLSPFEVEGHEGSGYKVTDTTAGTRIRTDLKDFGASLAVITAEFMEDLGSNDSETLLSMVGNMETGGVQGNFSNVSTGNSSTHTARINPQEAQRVRGLANAELTRDYFRTNLPFDSYNTTRVTINRGQNSMLYGLGSPGGVINASTNRAQIGSDFGQVGVRADHRDGHRETMNLNKTLVRDRLAVRVALLNEHTYFKQEPAFEKDMRFYLSWDAVLLENERSQFLGRTRFRGSFESGEILRNPPDTVPPIDGFSSWFEGIGGPDTLNIILRIPGMDLERIPSSALRKEWVLGAIEAGLVDVPEGLTPEAYASIEGTFVPKSEYNRILAQGNADFHGYIPYTITPAVNFNRQQSGTTPGWNSPELAGIQGIMGRWRPNGFPDQDVRWTSPISIGGGFTENSLSNRKIFDYHNYLWQGSTNRVTTDFEASQFFLEQDFLDGKAGIELAFDKQRRDQTSFNPLSRGDSKTISIDATTHLAPADSNFDGMPDRTPNENVGRPVVLVEDSERRVEHTDRKTFRNTIFGTVDTRDHLESFLGDVLGSHTFTGLYESRTDDSHSRQTRGVWWADQGDNPSESFITGGLNDHAFRRVYSQVYLGPDVRKFDGPEQVRINGPMNVRLPQINDSYGIWYFNNLHFVDDSEKNTWRVVEAVSRADRTKHTLVSKAAALQSHLLWDNLVTTVSIREDAQRIWGRLSSEASFGPTGSRAIRLDDPGINITDGNINEGLLETLEEDLEKRSSGETTTLSLAGHYPENWLGDLPGGMDLSAHYYEAESFEVGSRFKNVLNQVTEDPRGNTREYGITIGLLDNRLSVRVNRFRTAKKNEVNPLGFATFDLFERPFDFLINMAAAEVFDGNLFPSDADRLLTTESFPSNRQRTTGTDADLLGIDSFRKYYDLLLDIFPPYVQEIYGFRLVEHKPDEGIIYWYVGEDYGTAVATEDTKATGTEVEIAGRMTDGWSLSLNISQQETVRSNVGPLAVPLAFEMLERIQSLGLYDIRDDPFNKAETTIGSKWEEIIRTIRIAKGQEGIASPEQREWRVNILSRYDFKEGFLKGFSLGGALRYQDTVAAGYTDIWDAFGNAVPDVDNPFIGPDELNGDLFFRYQRKLTEKLEWSIQFNARNLYRKNGDDDIPVTINPDGRVALIRIPNEQQFFLSNTFRF